MNFNEKYAAELLWDSKSTKELNEKWSKVKKKFKDLKRILARLEDSYDMMLETLSDAEK